MTQINMSSRWTARIKVEDREACFKRLRKRRLGGSKETDTGQAGDPRVMESSMLKSVIIQVNKVTCESSWISLLCKSRFKVTSSKRVCSKNEDVDALTVLIEERSA